MTTKSSANSGDQKAHGIALAQPSRAEQLDAEGTAKILRPLAVLKLLEESAVGLTAQQLAQALEPNCSLRTVTRDLEHLQQCGLPVSSRGDRWVCTNTSASTPDPLALRPSEALSVLTSQDPLPAQQALDAGHTLSRVRHRLEASLTPKGRRWVKHLRRLEQATQRLAESVDRSRDDHRHTMALMEEACAGHRCVAMTYATPKAVPSRRVVEPHLLWMYAGNVYVMAYCRTHMAFRSFGIKHVQNAVLLDDHFAPRSEFDDDPFSHDGFGTLRGRAHDFVIELKPEIAHLARDWVWHPTQQVHGLGNGGVYLTFRCAGLAQVAAWVAGLGGKAQAVAPTELVGAVVQLHCRGIESHRAGHLHLDDGAIPGLAGHPPASAVGARTGRRAQLVASPPNLRAQSK